MPINKYYGKPKDQKTLSKIPSLQPKLQLSSFNYLKLIFIHLLFIGLLLHVIVGLINLEIPYQFIFDVILILLATFLGLFLSIRGYIRAWL